MKTLLLRLYYLIETKWNKIRYISLCSYFLASSSVSTICYYLVLSDYLWIQTMPLEVTSLQLLNLECFSRFPF